MKEKQKIKTDNYNILSKVSYQGIIDIRNHLNELCFSIIDRCNAKGEVKEDIEKMFSKFYSRLIDSIIHSPENPSWSENSFEIEIKKENIFRRIYNKLFKR